MGKNFTSGEAQNITEHVLPTSSLSVAQSELEGNWKDYISVTKPGIVRSNLLTMITGMWVANSISSSSLSVLTVLFAILGSTCIIASGTSLNNYIEKDIDAKMSRTQNRALVEGRLEPKNVLLFAIILLLLGTLLLLFVNLTTTLVALIGHLAYVGFYTLWSKPYHSINTIVGSISGAVPPLIGWAAVTGSLGLSTNIGAWIIFAIVFLWQPPHFLALAMRRCEDYRAAGIPMLPVVNGFYESKRQILRYVAALIPVSLLLFYVPSVNWVYVVMMLILGILWFIYSVMGFYTEDEHRWAKNNFFFSLIYLSLFCIGLMVITLF